MATLQSLLYSVSLSAYRLGANVVALSNAKAAKWVEGQKNAIQELDKHDFSKKSIWIHCASLGEYEQAKTVIDSLKISYPYHHMVLTFFSPSGYEIVKPKLTDITVLYLPLDSAENARLFIDKIKPELAVFIKYEHWYFYLKTLKEKGIPALSVSAIFRPSQPFFKWHGGIFREMLKLYTHIFVQDNESLKLLKDIGITAASVSGDTRFDRVWQIKEQQEALPIIEQFKGEHNLLVAGSTWPQDEELLIRFINQNHPQFAHWKFLIAPHEINLTHLGELAKQLISGAVTYSPPDRNPSARVMFVDSIGVLSRCYKYGNIAYIGGGFGAGIHNTLEAAANGIPVVFGPNHQKFKEANEMVAMGAAFTIDSYASLDKQLLELANNHEAGNKAGQYVQQQKGATDKVMKRIKEILPA